MSRFFNIHVATVVWVVIVSTGSRLPVLAAEPASDGPHRKTVIPSDPVNRQVALDQLKKGHLARRIQMAETTRQGIEWEGSTFIPTAKPGDTALLARQKEVCELFSAKQPPAPKERLDHYEWLLKQNRYVCVGWRALLLSSAKTTDGEVVELLVEPSVVTSDGQQALVMDRCRETWALDRDGDLKYQRLRTEAGSDRIISTE